MKTSIVGTTLATLLLALSATSYAAPETYVIDPTHTYPRFEYSHFGYSKQSSRFDKTSGSIMIDRVAKTGSVNVLIDATSISSGLALFNQHLQGEDFFDTARHPNITFKSTALKFSGDTLSSVQGNLTIKGITRPVTLTVTSFLCMPHPMRKKDACGANATAKIKRTDFNLGKYAPNVSDEVALSLGIEAVKL